MNLSKRSGSKTLVSGEKWSKVVISYPHWSVGPPAKPFRENFGLYIRRIYKQKVAVIGGIYLVYTLEKPGYTLYIPSYTMLYLVIQCYTLVIESYTLVIQRYTRYISRIYPDQVCIYAPSSF